MSESTKTDEFREEQAAAAAAQNQTADNAVPEQRPIASISVDAGEKESPLTKKLRDSGDPNVPVEEPHTQEDHDRAASDAQMKKAAKDSKSEGLMVGSRALATTGPHEGRVFAITRIVEHGSVADAVRSFSGDPTQVLNSPKTVEGTAIGDERDGERCILNVEDNGLEKLNEAWAGTRAGRRH